MATLVDTGILYALADADDEWHDRAVAWLDGCADVLTVPATVLPEVCYLLATRLGTRAERAFIESLARGELAVESVEPKDLERAAGIMADRPELGFVDASILALVERLGIRRLATTDRRHFGGIRLARGGRLELAP